MTESQPADATASLPAGRPATGVTEEATAIPSGAATPVRLRLGPPAAAGEVGALGPYRLVRALGRGGMGVVYLAVDTRLDRRLALKVMLPAFAAGGAARERFVREARAAARVKHDHVVTVYEADERDGVPYIAMEFLDGMPLDAYLKSRGRPTLPQAVRVAGQAAAGLAAAHRLGLVHRDVKPANLWLESPHGRVKVLDFGLARPVEAECELTRSGAIVGTPAYMSPEQARAQRVDARADLFGLGAVLYRLCTGRLPFGRPTTMAVLIAVSTEDPPPVRALNPAVPESLAALIHQLLAKRPDDRPRSAAEVVARLHAIARELALTRPAARDVTTQNTAPDVNPFAELETTASSLPPAAEAATPASRSRNRIWWRSAVGVLALGGALVAAVAMNGAAVKGPVGAKTKPGSEPPPGPSPSKMDERSGPAQVAPDGGAADRVVRLGGAVMLRGNERLIRAAPELPSPPFQLGAAFLDGTAVRDADLEALGRCARLTHLALSNTAVTDAGLAGLSNRPGLRYLSLLNTGVTDAGLLHLRVCTGLVYLNLQNTRVTARGVAALRAALPGCRIDHGGRDADRAAAELVVSLGGGVHANNDSTRSITNSAGLPSGRFALTHVALESSRAGDADLAALRDCHGLVFVHLAHLPVTDEGVSNVATQQGLLYLHLGGTKVTDAGLAHFRGQKGLKSLYLNGTGVGVGLANFTECSDLSYLHIGDTAVTDADMAGFKGHTALVSLYAYNTKSTDAGLADLEGCTGLTHLDIRGTKVTREGVERFSHAVPRCRVVWDGGVVEPRK